MEVSINDLKNKHEDTLAQQAKTISICQNDIESLKRNNHEK